MKYDIGEKTINIPDAFIEKNMAGLGITEAEAIELYLSDEGIVVNADVAEMTAKAKAAGNVITDAKGDKAKRKAPVRKPDMLKRDLIADIAIFVEGDTRTSNVEVTNIERMIAFEVGDERFEITLTKKRKPKE